MTAGMAEAVKRAEPSAHVMQITLRLLGTLTMPYHPNPNADTYPMAQMDRILGSPRCVLDANQYMKPEASRR